MWASSKGRPSSLNPIQPASANSDISDSSSPSLFFVMAPIGRTLIQPSFFALSSTNSTIALESITGLVLGMAQTVVKPPCAAALVPVAMVSLYSKPGSRRWQWRSMNPGEITNPLASIISPFSIKRLPTKFICCDGSIICPPRIRMVCLLSINELPFMHFCFHIHH